ncbi:MAG: aminotransferase class V-fold PLP-dependent enzyme [Eubacteriales bacterium]
MIYFDNSATTIQKPPSVAIEMAQSIGTLGNPSRSFHDPALASSRTLLKARSEVASLVGAHSPLSVAFTSGATESLNLVISSLISSDCHVITTVLEHNSVLRPLYLSGCELSILPCDDEGKLCLEGLPSLLQSNTKALVATHGSNLLGGISCVDRLRDFCKEHGLYFILDVSQTLGSVPVGAEMADVLCFTGHKGLMGPQGTGGIVATSPLPFSLVKTGGAGSDSFAPHQSLDFPDIFEAGTPNTHGLAGLSAAVSFLNEVTVEQISSHESTLCARLLEGLEQIDGVRIFGSRSSEDRLPVVGFLLGDRSAEEVSLQLWEGWQIATRAGSHCAPLLHERFGTQNRGMMRVSLGYYNKMDEVESFLSALDAIARGCSS